MRLAPSRQDDLGPSTRSRRRLWIGGAAFAVVAVATSGTFLLQQHQNGGSGAQSADAVAQDALDALAAKDRSALVKTSDSRLSGREAAAQELVDRCRTSDFTAASVDVRGGFGNEVAWADIAVPNGESNCRKLTLTLSRVHDGWYVALGSADLPSTRPTAATGR